MTERENHLLYTPKMFMSRCFLCGAIGCHPKPDTNRATHGRFYSRKQVRGKIKLMIFSNYINDIFCFIKVIKYPPYNIQVIEFLTLLCARILDVGRGTCNRCGRVLIASVPASDGST